MFCVQDKVRADVEKFAAEVNALETDAEASGALSEAQTTTGVNGGRPSLFDGYDVALVEADAEVAAAGDPQAGPRRCGLLSGAAIEAWILSLRSPPWEYASRRRRKTCLDRLRSVC